jgi:hypothetical protein
MGLLPHSTVTIEYDPVHNQAIVRSGKDIVDIAGTIRPRRGKAVLDARTHYEKNYQRV